MALISFPSELLITRSDLSLTHPGQVALRSLYGAGTQVLGRGPGLWRGRLEIAETDPASDDERRAMELFLTRLRGAENTFEVPLHRPSGGRLAEGTVLSVSAATLTAGVVEVTVSGAASGLVAGDYVSMGGRLYQLTTPHQGFKFKVEPPVTPASGTLLWENVTCWARLADEGRWPVSSWTPDFGGPWTIEWEEAV